jgi:type II secretory pathway pseudopilin PulG
MIAFAIVCSLLALLLWRGVTKTAKANKEAQNEFYDHLDRF